jgi:transcriptional regulator of met regulon
MNTFEWHFRDFKEFITGILSWSPDYVVPVAKKGKAERQKSAMCLLSSPTVVKSLTDADTRAQNW